MTVMTPDRLVEDYVQRLERAARHLPADRREELVLEIREHIDQVLNETGSHDELAIRNALERLGPPEEIIAAAEPPAPPAPPQETTRRLEVAAVVALAIPFVGWFVGAVLVALSRVWSNREKAIGLSLALLAILLPLATGAAFVGPFDFLALLAILLGGIPSAIYLGWRLSLKRKTA